MLNFINISLTLFYYNIVVDIEYINYLFSTNFDFMFYRYLKMT